LVDVCDLGFDVTFLGCGRWNFKLLGFLDSAFSFSCGLRLLWHFTNTSSIGNQN
jgi:hypothetical protein